MAGFIRPLRAVAASDFFCPTFSSRYRNCRFKLDTCRSRKLSTVSSANHININLKTTAEAKEERHFDRVVVRNGQQSVWAATDPTKRKVLDIPASDVVEARTLTRSAFSTTPPCREDRQRMLAWNVGRGLNLKGTLPWWCDVKVTNLGHSYSAHLFPYQYIKNGAAAFRIGSVYAHHGGHLFLGRVRWHHVFFHSTLTVHANLVLWRILYPRCTPCRPKPTRHYRHATGDSTHRSIILYCFLVNSDG